MLAQILNLLLQETANPTQQKQQFQQQQKQQQQQQVIQMVTFRSFQVVNPP